MNIKEYEAFYHDELLNDVVPFWVDSDLLDRKYGGVNSSVDRQGKRYNPDKSVWFQGRALWSFSALCNKYGVRPQWKEIADSAAAFIKAHCIDEDGRMFFTVTEDGRPLRKRRYFFSESFLTVGFAEYYKLTGDPADLALAEKYFDLMFSIYCDPSTDPFKITPKECEATRSCHSMSYPMVLISSSQILRKISGNTEKYNAVNDKILHDIFTLHYKEDLHCVLETVLSDGSLLDTPAGRTVNPGHSFENSWFLMNEALVRGDDDLMQKALNILNWSFELGWDKEYGGVNYFVDCKGLPEEQLEYDMRLWWVHNEALIASLMAYSITKEQKYFDMFEKVHDYAFSHFKDSQYGEWYGYLHRDGTVSHSQKGSLWKGPYHLIRCLMTCETLLAAIDKGETTDILF